MKGAPPGRVVIVSPHLDDAVLSVGAFIAEASRTGARVTVLTVFAGAPEGNAAAGDWDRAAGFRTTGEAIRARREEDARACRIVGAHPVWLPHVESDGVADETLWPEVRDALADADVVLVPGYPLTHPDHVAVARLVLGRIRGADGRAPRLGLYVEEPYAAWAGRPPSVPDSLRDLVAGDVTWTTVRGAGVDRRNKRRAGRAYRSQLRLLTRRVPVVWKIARFEARAGGEGIGWLAGP